MHSDLASERIQVRKGTTWKTTVTEHRSSSASEEGNFGLIITNFFYYDKVILDRRSSMRFRHREFFEVADPRDIW
jgi:hypothetical protein